MPKFTNLVIISQCIGIANYQVIQLKYIYIIFNCQLYLNKSGKHKKIKIKWPSMWERFPNLQYCSLRKRSKGGH